MRFQLSQRVVESKGRGFASASLAHVDISSYSPLGSQMNTCTLITSFHRTLKQEGNLPMIADAKIIPTQ